MFLWWTAPVWPGLRWCTPTVPTNTILWFGRSVSIPDSRCSFSCPSGRPMACLTSATTVLLAKNSWSVIWAVFHRTLIRICQFVAQFCLSSSPSNTYECNPSYSAPWLWCFLRRAGVPSQWSSQNSSAYNWNSNPRLPWLDCLSSTQSICRTRNPALRDPSATANGPISSYRMIAWRRRRLAYPNIRLLRRICRWIWSNWSVRCLRAILGWVGMCCLTMMARIGRIVGRISILIFLKTITFWDRPHLLLVRQWTLS